MYLHEIIGDKGEVLAKAMLHPALSPKRKPTVDNAMKAVVAELEFTVASQVKAKYTPTFQDMYDMYCLENGDFDMLDPTQRDEWGSGLDDKVEELLEPLQATLSADWLARFTIDTHLEAENGCIKLAEALGKEIFKQLAYGKEPGQVLSNAGIFRTDVELYFEQHMQPKSQEETKAMADDNMAEINGVIGRIHTHIGGGYDTMDVYDAFERITDEDEILSGAGAQWLGMTEEDLQCVQMYVIEVGAKGAADGLFNMLVDYTPGTAPTPPAPPAPVHTAYEAVPIPPAPTPTAPSAPKAPPAQTATGFDGKYVLSMLKEHSAAKDTELSTEMGVSRSTFTNWSNGKTPFAPTQEQLTTLRNRVLEDINGLYSALCNIDDVHVDRIFE